MLSVVMLNVLMLNVVMLSVVVSKVLVYYSGFLNYYETSTYND